MLALQSVFVSTCKTAKRRKAKLRRSPSLTQPRADLRRTLYWSLKSGSLPMPAKSSRKARRSPRKLTSLVEGSGALSPSDSVDTAATRMREMDTKQWPVAEGRTLVGMVEGAQPSVTVGRHGHDPKTWRVSEIMNRSAVFCYEDEDCTSACRVMKEHGLTYLPVVDRQMRIVGIFSVKEVADKASPSSASH